MQGFYIVSTSYDRLWHNYIMVLLQTVVMAKTNTGNGFKTDAFSGALKKNEEMNKNGKVENDEPLPGNEENVIFTTDAFKEALKINEETNKKDSIPKADTDSPAKK